MKELDHIEKMLKQGKLTLEQAELLKASLKESKQRKTKLNPRKPDDEEKSPTSKIWIVPGGLFMIFLAGLFFSSGNKPLFFLLLLAMISFGCLAVFLLVSFNILTWKKEGVLRTRALITNEVERKKSLAPQIRESVSAYAGHESETHEKVIRERSATAAGGELKADPSSFPFQALVERYSEIKSDQTYMQLFNQYVEIENRITAMVQWYNHKAHSYNGIIEAFPFSLIAEAFSFKKATYLESA